MSTPTEAKNFLALLKEVENSNAFCVYVPSLEREVKFKPLTTEQFKRILKTAIDSPIYNTEFTLKFNDIIKENCLEKDIDVNALTVYDKLIIIYKTRIECVSPIYTGKFSEEEIATDNPDSKTFNVDLSNKLEAFLAKGVTFGESLIHFNAYEVVCCLPTLETENLLEKELHKNIKIEVDTPEELRTIVGETFINELTKYFKTVKVNETTIVFKDLTFKERIKIVECLPVNVINGIIKYIEHYRDTIKELTTHTYTEKEIPLDASFFNA